MKNNNAHKTAITRNKPSVPMRFLDKKGLLVGSMLDYGCGKGFDADHYSMDKYDPHYSPTQLTDKYDTITCNYVFNVIDPDQEEELLNNIGNLLNDNGKAYITVRRDIKKEGFTSKKTFQRNVTLNLPVIRETSTYCTYILTRGGME